MCPHGQVGDVDSEGVPHPEAEEPEEDSALNKAQRGDAHDHPVHDGNSPRAGPWTEVFPLVEACWRAPSATNDVPLASSI